MCCRSSRQPPLWSRGPETTVRFISSVCQSLLAQVILHLSSNPRYCFFQWFYCCSNVMCAFARVLLSLCRFLEPSSSLDPDHLHPYEELEARLPSALLEELFGIALLVGRLKDLPGNVQSAFMMSNHGKVVFSAWESGLKNSWERHKSSLAREQEKETYTMMGNMSYDLFFSSALNPEFTSTLRRRMLSVDLYTAHIELSPRPSSHRFFRPLGTCYTFTLTSTGHSWSFFTCWVTSCKVHVYSLQQNTGK